MALYPYTAAVIMSGGGGSRMGNKVSKQWLAICAKPMLYYSLAAFENCPLINSITVVCRAGDEEITRKLCENSGIKKLTFIVCGGETRQESVEHGIMSLPNETEYIAIHDAARPLITVSDITEICMTAYTSGAATAALDVTDTMKRVNSNGIIVKTLDRNKLRAASTPQVFALSEYRRACIKAKETSFVVTDDNMLFEMLGLPVMAVRCDSSNIKMTYPTDLKFAEAVIKERKIQTKYEAEMRIGHGYDVHRLVCDRPLILGGVRIPYSRGLLGHSDADVLLHAITDALLGAAGLPDIGHLYPDTDDKYEGADSLELLSDAIKRVYELGYVICNIDATVIAQAPKISPYIDEMKQKISAALGVTADRVGIKATTEEGLGFTGAGDGIAAHAVCLLNNFAD